MKRGVVTFLQLSLLAIETLAVTGCSQTVDVRYEKRTLQAYGEQWNYQSVIHVMENRWDFSDKRRHRQELFLDNGEAGEALAVHERIYALQKDGRYEKVEYVSSEGEIHSKDNSLYLYFRMRNRDVTDCLALEPYRQPSFRHYPRWVEYFGVFDPKSQVFLVNSFNIGIDFPMPAGQEQAEEPVSEQRRSVEFVNRQPFVCDDAEINRYWE